MNTPLEIRPCPQILSSLERISEGKERGGIFMWYVKKHVEKCAHCAEALDALLCYQDAVRQAYADTLQEGNTGINPEEMSQILDGLSFKSDK